MKQLACSRDSDVIRELAHVKDSTKLGEGLRRRTEYQDHNSQKEIENASRRKHHTDLAQGVIGRIPTQISNGAEWYKEGYY